MPIAKRTALSGIGSTSAIAPFTAVKVVPKMSAAATRASVARRSSGVEVTAAFCSVLTRARARGNNRAGRHHGWHRVRRRRPE